jgi:hypothetical protein
VIWLLFDYEEDGPESLWAVSRFEDLIPLARAYYPDEPKFAESRAELFARLDTMRADEFPVDKNVLLIKGGGGLTVRAVELSR